MKGYGLKFCSCRMCRIGRGRNNWAGHTIRSVNRRFRKQTKMALHKGEYEKVPVVISVPYTD